MRERRARRGLWLAFLGMAASAVVGNTHVVAQESGAADLVNIFFDCQAPGCRDLDFFRREAPFVNWVLDRAVADVHVLVTSQETGGGGRAYVTTFIGLGDFLGEDRELAHSSAGDATNDEQRNGLVDRLRLGLVRYVQQTPAAERLRVTYDDGGGRRGGPGGPGAGQDDPWNAWVFRLRGNGFINGQATSKFSNYFGTLEANRTTEAWKISLSGNYSRNAQRFDVEEDGEPLTIREVREDWGSDALFVRSVGGQWAVGLRADAGSSTFVNQDFRWSVKPGVEYNFLPYSESSRRSLTLQYLVGPNHFNYTEETIFLETSETRLQQSLTASLSLVQPWGRWSTSLTGDQYLHDTSKYQVSLSGSFNVRLFRGFSINLGGNYSWIRDQLFISGEGATQSEILLQQRQLGTSYQYFTSFGIEYRFGSIFNNVVNPRFGRGGQTFFFN